MSIYVRLNKRKNRPRCVVPNLKQSQDFATRFGNEQGQNALWQIFLLNVAMAQNSKKCF